MQSNEVMTFVNLFNHPVGSISKNEYLWNLGRDTHLEQIDEVILI